MSSDLSPAQPVVSAEQALEFVARASALLARSLDYETTLRQVARLAVPEVADWCGVLLIEPDGEERELSSGYSDPELDAVLREIRERRRATADASPAILRRDGTVEMAGRFGMMVGLGVEPLLHDVELRIGAGDVLLLYTDGVTEAGPRGEPFGEQGVASVLRELAGVSPQAVVNAVERAAVAAQPGDPRDDIALLAISVPA